MVMRIKELREKRGMAQKELACRMGVSPTVVCNWETELALPKSRDLPLLSKILDVAISELYQPEALAADAGPYEAC